MGSSISSQSFDVVVVGSGPAGSSAAYVLSKEGVRTVLVEKESLPRYKTCGGGIVQRAVCALPVDIGAAVERHCYAAELHLPGSGLHFSTQRERPIVSMTMRDRFDLLLVEAAQQAGTQLRAHCRVLDVIREGNKTEVLTSQGSIQTDFVIAADGATSTVARVSSLPKIPHLMPALECEVTVKDQDLERFAHSARFDFAPVPAGYGWVFPKKRHLSIGVLKADTQSLNLNSSLEKYLRLVGVTEIKALDRHGFMIPTRPRAEKLVEGKIILTGDAAGLADPVTGEGITFAIRSGQLAARALVDGDFQENQVRDLYVERLSREVLSELRWGRLLGRVIYQHPRVRDRLFRRHGQRLCQAMTDVLTGERTYRDILRRPANYLRLFTARSH